MPLDTVISVFVALRTECVERDFIGLLDASMSSFENFLMYVEVQNINNDYQRYL